MQSDLVISDLVSEELKIRIGSVNSEAVSSAAEVHGRRVSTGTPASEVVTTEMIQRATTDLVDAMVAGVAMCLAEAPPELAQDAIFEGIHIVGGTANLDGLVARLEIGTSVPVHVANNSVASVVEGTARCLNELDQLASSTLTPSKAPRAATTRRRRAGFPSAISTMTGRPRSSPSSPNAAVASSTTS